LKDAIAALERELASLAADDPVVTRLRTIPGIGLLTATALVGSVGISQLAGAEAPRPFRLPDTASGR
jgi:transposase